MHIDYVAEHMWSDCAYIMHISTILFTFNYQKIKFRSGTFASPWCEYATGSDLNFHCNDVSMSLEEIGKWCDCGYGNMGPKWCKYDTGFLTNN